MICRRDSFITHRAFCDALAEESAKTQTVAAPPTADEDPKLQSAENSSPTLPPPPPPPQPPAAAAEPAPPAPPSPAPAPAAAPPPPPPPCTVVMPSTLPIQTPGIFVSMLPIWDF